MFRCLVGIGCVVGAALAMLASVAHAQDPVLEEVYGQGVHAFFAGRYTEAFDYLSVAASGGSKDPRVYYFKALAESKLGRESEAEADMKAGARLETDDVEQYYPVSRSLERVQGRARLSLERFRMVARAEQRERQEKLNALRYEQRERSEAAVRRPPVAPAPASAGDTAAPVRKAPPPPKPAADMPKADDPFGSSTEPAGDAAAPAADNAEPAADPFGESEAAKPPVDAKMPADDAAPAEEEAPAADAPAADAPAEEAPAEEAPAADAEMPAAEADMPAEPAAAGKSDDNPFGEDGAAPAATPKAAPNADAKADVKKPAAKKVPPPPLPMDDPKAKSAPKASADSDNPFGDDATQPPADGKGTDKKAPQAPKADDDPFGGDSK